VQIAIAADSLFDPFLALTVFLTDLTHISNFLPSFIYFVPTQNRGHPGSRIYPPEV
jgi:hypothetical protein